MQSFHRIAWWNWTCYNYGFRLSPILLKYKILLQALESKVCGPYVVSFLTFITIFAWCMASFANKYWHQKRHVSQRDWTICSYTYIILGLVVNMIKLVLKQWFLWIPIQSNNQCCMWLKSITIQSHISW